MSSNIECCQERVAKRSRLFTRLDTQHFTEPLSSLWFFKKEPIWITGVIKFPGKTAVTARAHTRLHLVGWPNALDNTWQRSTFLNLTKLHSTKAIHAQLHSTRWPNALDISLYMNFERCIVESRERLAGTLQLLLRFVSVCQ